MNVTLDTQTQFIYSTSGSQSSIVKYNEGLQKLGLNLLYFTFPDSISAQTYEGCLRAPFCRGGAVTAHGGLKTTIIPHLDVVEELAQKCQAVNTVVHSKTDDKLYGYNTDVYGLETALQQGFRKYNFDVSSIKTAVIYGNGGVSGVAWYVLKKLFGEDAKIAIVGRNPNKVLQKRNELGINDDVDPHFDGPYDLVIDATPIAFETTLPEQFTKICQTAKLVFCHSMPEKDGKSTNSVETYCNANGIAFIPGAWMHTGQMIKQYSLYFAEEETSKKITEQDICDTWNLVMPS